MLHRPFGQGQVIGELYSISPVGLALLRGGQGCATMPCVMYRLSAHVRAFLVLTVVLGQALVHASPAQGVTPVPTGARIDEPKPNATVRGVVRIIGTAATSNFQRYEVGIFRGSTTDQAFIPFLCGGNNQVLNGLLCEWNTAGAPDGLYTIRLRAVKIDGNYDEATVTIRLDTKTTPTPTVTPTSAISPSPVRTPTPIIIGTPVIVGAPSPTPVIARPTPSPTPLFGVDLSRIINPTPWVRAFATGAFAALAALIFIAAVTIARHLLSGP